MKKIAAFLICFLIIFSFASCEKSDEKIPEKTDRETVNYELKGEGKNQFYLDIIFESDEKHYNIKTDEKTVGAALENLDIIKGEQGPYGLFISSVEGEEHIYEKGGKYWAFYVHGQYAPKSVDQTDIENGTTYALKVE